MAKKATTRKKKAAKGVTSGAPSAAAPAGLKVPAAGVRVRMYRQGFGDCFLLSFGRGSQKPWHMLIDCGLLTGAPSPDRMRAAVQQIRDETGGALDVVVCTHEHVDHLSGFLHARETWSKMSIGDLWFAWTEDPGNATANHLREERERRKQGLRATTKKLGVLGAGAMGAAAQVEAALTFFGATGSTSDTAAALEFVRDRFGKRPTYLTPGQIQAPPGLPGVRFYVLGPPTVEALLKKSDPSSKAPEVYHAAGAMTADSAFFAAAAGAGGDVSKDEQCTRADRSSPFEAVFRIAVRGVEKGARRATDEERYLHNLYYARSRRESDVIYLGGRPVRRSKWDAQQDWRRIDTDWLGVAGALAMKLDEDTNNTSLVLAIEFTRSEQVLLFPGDAQVGNWLSWDLCEFSVKDADGKSRRVTAADLLGRTVLYKVGHHSSHNATLKEKGLERMTSERLAAMIPVDEATAKKQGKNGWSMPFPPLLRALNETTAGRVLRADAGEPSGTGKNSADRNWFAKASKVTDLFVDMVIEDS